MRTLLRGRFHGMNGDSNGVLVEDGVITWVGAGRPPEHADDELTAGPEELIAPGFIDLQVNGFGGHDAAGGWLAMAWWSASRMARWRGAQPRCPTWCG